MDFFFFIPIPLPSILNHKSRNQVYPIISFDVFQWESEREREREREAGNTFPFNPKNIEIIYESLLPYPFEKEKK